MKAMFMFTRLIYERQKFFFRLYFWIRMVASRVKCVFKHFIMFSIYDDIKVTIILEHKLQCHEPFPFARTHTHAHPKYFERLYEKKNSLTVRKSSSSCRMLSLYFFFFLVYVDNRLISNVINIINVNTRNRFYRWRAQC